MFNFPVELFHMQEAPERFHNVSFYSDWGLWIISALTDSWINNESVFKTGCWEHSSTSLLELNTGRTEETADSSQWVNLSSSCRCWSSSEDRLLWLQSRRTAVKSETAERRGNRQIVPKETSTETVRRYLKDNFCFCSISSISCCYEVTVMLLDSDFISCFKSHSGLKSASWSWAAEICLVYHTCCWFDPKLQDENHQVYLPLLIV